MKSLEHERDKLKSLLKETKGSLHKIEREMTEHQTEKDEEKNKIWVSTVMVLSFRTDRSGQTV